jgi:hypothetical protein
MADFDTTTDSNTEVSDEERESLCDRSRGTAKYLLRRFVLLVSFGPGVLGLLWLIGRIIRR